MGNAQIDVTAEELLDILRDYKGVDSNTRVEDGLTRQEIQDVLGWGVKKTLRYLKEAIKDGHIAPVYVGRDNSHGERTSVKGYAIQKQLA